jgi:hypothetical protein
MAQPAPQCLRSAQPGRLRAGAGCPATVAEQRIAFLTGLYSDLGQPLQRARLLARLAYATYIGLMRVTAETPEAPLSTEDLEAFTDEVTRALLPPVQ